MYIRKNIKICIVFLILGLYISNVMAYASGEAVNAVPYEMESQSDIERYISGDEVLKDYIKRYVPEDAKYVPAESTSKLIYNANVMFPREIGTQSVYEEEIEGSFFGNVYTFSSLKDGEEIYDVIVDCYFLKTWKPYENDRLSILFDGYLGYVSPVEGELWGKNSDNGSWSFEKELGISTNIISGVALGNTSPFPRILLHFPAIRINEEQEQSYCIVYEVPKRETKYYFVVMSLGVIVLIVAYCWKRKRDSKNISRKHR